MNSESPSQTPCLVRLLGVVLRLIFVLIVGVALGVGLYFGSLALYQQFIRPVQEHSIRLAQLENSLEQQEQLQKQRLDGFAERLEILEIQGDKIKETLAGMDSKIEGVETSQATQTAEMQSALGQLESLDATLAELQERDRAQNRQIEILRAEFKTESERVQTDIKDLRNESEGAQQAILDYQTDFQSLRDDVMEQLQVLKVMEILTRARLNLAQGNLSLAIVDIDGARELLMEIDAAEGSSKADQLDEAVSRLDQALEFLPSQPVSAADELEGAWQVLLGSFSSPQETTDLEDLLETPAPQITATPIP